MGSGIDEMGRSKTPESKREGREGREGDTVYFVSTDYFVSISLSTENYTPQPRAMSGFSRAMNRTASSIRSMAKGAQTIFNRRLPRGFGAWRHHGGHLGHVGAVAQFGIIPSAHAGVAPPDGLIRFAIHMAGGL